jgi:hypothetical protein
MKLNKFVSVLALLLSTLFVFGQDKDTFYHEKINIHLNATAFLAGERVLMTVYCADISNRPSSLSSIVYVELIGEDIKPIVQSKVTLRDGIGEGHFLLPNFMNSGNYTLIAYTRWMRNFSEKEFFRKEITIINPLRLDHNRLVQDIQPVQKATSLQPQITPLAKVTLDKEQYGLRELVTMSLTNNDSESYKFSISVRLLDEDVFLNEDFGLFLSENHQDSLDAKEFFQFLPDLRGELLTGTVFHKSTNLPLKQSLVSISVPSKEFKFLISRTDSSGRFYFNLPPIESGQLFFALPGNDLNDFNLKVDNPFLEDYSSFLPSKFYLESKDLEIVERRFVHQQINAAFGAVKKDSILIKNEELHFYGNPEKLYILDNYTRFPTMEDVFRELIPEIIVKKRGDIYSLELFNFKYGFRFDGPPLILIDGIIVEDIADVMAFDPMLIKQISIRNRQYFYGDMSCNGIVSIETFNGNATGLRLDKMSVIEYVPTTQHKLFFSPVYDQRFDLLRVPDYRIQLFWNPEVVLKESSADTFTFFISDVPGKYLISIMGVKSTGELIYQSHKFKVLDNK